MEPDLSLSEEEEEEAKWKQRALDARAALALKLQIKEDDVDPEEERAWKEDREAWYASRFREEWEFLWGGDFGSFEDTTCIPPMRYTDVPPAPPDVATTTSTLQIFSVTITRLLQDQLQLEWPLHVYGMVALRDPIDHNRNIIFNRTRDNCQTVTQHDPCLALTGPSRAVVVFDAVVFEVVLKLKGATESEDRDLSSLAVSYQDQGSYTSTRLLKMDYTSKLSTVEFVLGHLMFSVEATISVRVVDGSWSDASHGIFVARTDSVSKDVLLLDSQLSRVHVTGDGIIELPRCVVSVEYHGQLKVRVSARQDVDSQMIVGEHDFTPQRAGRSNGQINVGFCRMKITAAWSLFT